MDIKDKIIVIALIYFTYLALFKERQSLGCENDGIKTFLSSNPSCNNADNHYSRIIREERPQNPFDVFNRIVIWRRSFLLSLIIVSMYHLIIRAEFDGVKFMSGVIIGTFFLYFSFNFYKYHLDDYLYKEIMKNYTITSK